MIRCHFRVWLLLSLLGDWLYGRGAIDWLLCTGDICKTVGHMSERLDLGILNTRFLEPIHVGCDMW